MAITNDITFFFGEDIVLNFTEQSVADITGWTIVLTIIKPDGTKLTKNATLTAPTSAQYQIVLAHADTITLPKSLSMRYDVQRTNSGFDSVLSSGYLSVLPEALY